MPILCQKHHSKMGLKTTPKGLNVNSPRWNLGFHKRRYKNGMRNSNQKKAPSKHPRWNLGWNKHKNSAAKKTGQKKLPVNSLGCPYISLSSQPSAFLTFIQFFHLQGGSLIADTPCHHIFINLIGNFTPFHRITRI
jgi:hypothetical protein